MSIFAQREADDTAHTEQVADTRYAAVDVEKQRLMQIASDANFISPRVAILQEGSRLTSGDRDKTYGDPIINLACSGELKAVFRKYMQRKLSTAELEAIDMVLTKVGRIATGPKFHRDTYVDAATYMAIAGEMAMRNDAEKSNATGL